uniref:Uncharacterized protein n=1 Tax=viral metagenome TaxID=1070528 RepID=A0A6M3X518_9ZZZZ
MMKKNYANNLHKRWTHRKRRWTHRERMARQAQLKKLKDTEETLPNKYNFFQLGKRISAYIKEL